MQCIFWGENGRESPQTSTAFRSWLTICLNLDCFGDFGDFSEIEREEIALAREPAGSERPLSFDKIYLFSSRYWVLQDLAFLVWMEFYLSW